MKESAWRFRRQPFLLPCLPVKTTLSHEQRRPYTIVVDRFIFLRFSSHRADRGRSYGIALATGKLISFSPPFTPFDRT